LSMESTHSGAHLGIGHGHVCTKSPMPMIRSIPRLVRAEAAKMIRGKGRWVVGDRGAHV